MLPKIEGARILDLGCGFGAFNRWAIEQDAECVVALDLSEKMLARAREQDTSHRIDYRLGDLSRMEVDGTFDLIYSALAFHYVRDFKTLCQTMRDKLVEGGRLVATVEHPVYTAPINPSWSEDETGKAVWPVNNYLNEGKRVTNWLAPGVVKYHRTIESYISSLLENRFALVRMIEWGPDAEQVREHPEWERERDRPMFLLFCADAIS
jgi:cyclopropane fatty-acyl-phospholipid synthase-like methyltransferase